MMASASETRMRVVNVDDLKSFEGQVITVLGYVKLSVNQYTLEVRSADDTVTTVEMPISMSKLTPGWADVVGTVIGGRLMYSRMAQYEKLEGNRAFSHECYIQAVEIFNRLVLKAEEI